MPAAPHVAAAIAACAARPAAQPKTFPPAPSRAGHVSASVAAGRGGGAPLQAKPGVSSFRTPLGMPPCRAIGRLPAIQRMKKDDEDLWNLPGFLFSNTGGFYVGQAPRKEIALVEGEKPTKTYLYLGAGDLSAPARKAKKHKNQSGYNIVATELQTEKNLRKTGGEGFDKNLRKLLKRGHTVAFEVDATANVKGAYDRIIFNNPHTGKYGNAESSSAWSDVESITSNKVLLGGIFESAKGHLEKNGLLEITICGFPYISSTYGQRQYVTLRQGMGLENKSKANSLAQLYGWQLVNHMGKGEQQIRRNNGEWFKATVYKLTFRQA